MSSENRLGPIAYSYSDVLEVHLQGSIPWLRGVDQPGVIQFRLRDQRNARQSTDSRFRNLLELLDDSGIHPQHEARYQDRVREVLKEFEIKVIALGKIERDSQISSAARLFFKATGAAAAFLKVDLLSGALRMDGEVYTEIQGGIRIGGVTIYPQRTLGTHGTRDELVCRLGEVRRDADLRLDLLGIGDVRVTRVVEYRAISVRLQRLRQASKAVAQSPRRPVSTQPRMFYSGILLLLAIQFAKANGIGLPIAYETALFLAGGLTAFGLSAAVQARKNSEVAWGISLAYIGWAWPYLWESEFVRQTSGVLLALGIVLILLGTIPGIVGGVCLLVGAPPLVYALYLSFTAGLGAVPNGIWLPCVLLVVAGSWMVRRQKYLSERGWFVKPE